MEFNQNPAILFQSFQRYKVKDTYATEPMLLHAAARLRGKHFNLGELKNIMVIQESRPPVDVYVSIMSGLGSLGLNFDAINTTYCNALNPTITTRAYMGVAPFELYLDTKLLRHGFVCPVDGNAEMAATGSVLHLQESGSVPVNTRIAIVNPETCMLSRIGEYGEIWVNSPASAKNFYGSQLEFDQSRFKARLADGDPHSVYVRTGDLGFLHPMTQRVGPMSQTVDMQVLFVLGGIGDTFEVNGLNHFAVDIERSIERCHPAIVNNGTVIFQAGGLVVAVVEVTRKQYLSSMVPVVLHAVLSEHQIIVDVVAFIAVGHSHRSRLGEKQRGKILSGWVSRKLPTLAQFNVRNMEPGADVTRSHSQSHSLLSRRQSLA